MMDNSKQSARSLCLHTFRLHSVPSFMSDCCGLSHWQSSSHFSRASHQMPISKCYLWAALLAKVPRWKAIQSAPEWDFEYHYGNYRRFSGMLTWALPSAKTHRKSNAILLTAMFDGAVLVHRKPNRCLSMRPTTGLKIICTLSKFGPCRWSIVKMTPHTSVWYMLYTSHHTLRVPFCTPHHTHWCHLNCMHLINLFKKLKFNIKIYL